MQCQDVATGVDVKKYQFDHSEADTIMISVYAHLRENGYTSPVVLDVADTDVYVTASYAANKYNGDLLIRRGGDFLNCKTLFDESVVDCLIQFHAVTGCDASSSYYGTSKGKLFDKLINSDRAKQQLKKCGDCVELTPECKANLLLFTREVIYADPNSNTMAEARARKWSNQRNKSFCRLPPDEDTLTQHFKRANYLAYLLKHPSLREHPSPIGKGWEFINNKIRPVRYTKPALPHFLDTLNCTDNLISEATGRDIDNNFEKSGVGPSGDGDCECGDGDSEFGDCDSECGDSDNETDDDDIR